jgi:TetR/AcrR family transcriptional repressor of nem operon
MPRVIEFNYEKAIDRATQLFWRKGYSQTSLRDLLKVMQIGEGSFYNTLKSKKSLFLQCLKHYNDTVGRKRRTALLSSPSAKEGVRAFFRHLVDELEDPKCPRACLMGRSVASDVFAERELKVYVQEGMATFVSSLRDRFILAKESGELPSNFDADSVAHIIRTYTQGFFPSALASYNRAQLEREIDVFVTSIGL